MSAPSVQMAMQEGVPLLRDLPDCASQRLGEDRLQLFCLGAKALAIGAEIPIEQVLDLAGFLRRQLACRPWFSRLNSLARSASTVNSPYVTPKGTPPALP